MVACVVGFESSVDLRNFAHPNMHVLSGLPQPSARPRLSTPTTFSGHAAEASTTIVALVSKRTVLQRSAVTVASMWSVGLVAWTRLRGMVSPSRSRREILRGQHLGAYQLLLYFTSCTRLLLCAWCTTACPCAHWRHAAWRVLLSGQLVSA